MSRELCGICMCPLDETGCGCPPEEPIQQTIPKTYEEYMASGMFSKEWEAGFIAGKMHELERTIKERMERV